MPFSDITSLVSMIGKPTCHGWQFWVDGLAKVHHTASEARAAGQNFGSTGSTDGIRAGGVQKAASAFDEPIQTGRLNQFIAQSVDRVRTLVVADQQQHVGMFECGSGQAPDGCAKQNQRSHRTSFLSRAVPLTRWRGGLSEVASSMRREGPIGRVERMHSPRMDYVEGESD